jgi:hypothetical protein
VLLTITALPATQPAADRPAAGRAPAQQPAANPARPPSRPPARLPANRPTSTRAGRAGDGCPPVKRVPAWLACLWRQANPPEPNQENGHAMPLSPAPPTWRSRF